MKQVSVFIENKSGTLIDVLQLLGDAGVQLYAISIADTVDYGICRMVCDNPDKALTVLKEGGVAASLSQVIAVKMDNIPGGAADIVRLFAKAGISLAYIYSFLYDNTPILAFRPDNAEKAMAVIADNKLEVIESL